MNLRHNLVKPTRIASVALLLCAIQITAALAELKTIRVTDNIYALVGEKQQRSEQNLANNATFGVIITDEGVVLVDPGGSWKGAQEIDTAISAITSQPVKFVINTGGQDHRWIGNSYWRESGAQIIASQNAIEDQTARASMQMTMLGNLIKDSLDGTDPVTADIVFDETYDLEIGGLAISIIHPGQAHTPGDSFVWLKSSSVLFTGDIVYLERILGISDYSETKSWMHAFEQMEKLQPAHLVPGHGAPAGMAEAKAQTYDYLANIRDRMSTYIEDGGDIIGSVEVDQSAFSFLEQFDALARRNAQTTFQQMEWE